MTVPALTTADIATFAYHRQTSCTYVQLADVLSILHNYHQYAEYVDGTIKIFDTGSESASPNNYVLVNVRIRADGWIMAWFPRTLMTGAADSGSGVVVTDNVMEIQRNGESSASAVAVNELAGYIFKPTSGPLSGNEYCIKSNTTTTITLHEKYGDDVSTDVGTLAAATYTITQSRGNLVWWGHTSNSLANPTSQSTRLGRALYEMWEQLKTNQQGGSGAALGYSDVGYWDYEHTSATHLYIFGNTAVGGATVPSTTDLYYYCTIPSGVVVYSGILNYSFHNRNAYCTVLGSIEAVTKYSATTTDTNGFVNIDETSVFSTNYGVSKTVRIYAKSTQGGWRAETSQAVVLLTSG
jgi:hypothetical protein